MVMYEIHHILVATTAHLRKETVAKLPQSAGETDDALGASFPGWPTFTCDDGWMWYVPLDTPGFDETCKELSSELCNLFVIAHQQGCCWLMLDNNGPTIEGLEKFQW